jgi:hypothetical protein
MARSTWDSLVDFAKQTNRCGCKRQPDPDTWKTVQEFVEASGGGFYDRRRHTTDEIDASYIDNKIRILGSLSTMRSCSTKQSIERTKT